MRLDDRNACDTNLGVGEDRGLKLDCRRRSDSAPAQTSASELGTMMEVTILDHVQRTARELRDGFPYFSHYDSISALRSAKWYASCAAGNYLSTDGTVEDFDPVFAVLVEVSGDDPSLFGMPESCAGPFLFAAGGSVTRADEAASEGRLDEERELYGGPLPGQTVDVDTDGDMLRTGGPPKELRVRALDAARELHVSDGRRARRHRATRCRVVHRPGRRRGRLWRDRAAGRARHQSSGCRPEGLLRRSAVQSDRRRPSLKPQEA